MLGSGSRTLLYNAPLTAWHLPLCCPFIAFFMNRVSTRAYSDSCGCHRNSSSLINFFSQLQAQMFFIQTCLNFIWTASKQVQARNGSRALNLSFPVISIQRWIRIDSAEYIEGLMIHCTWHVIELVELKLKVCFYWRSHHPTYCILGSAAVVTKGFSMCSAPSYSGCSCI